MPILATCGGCRSLMTGCGLRISEATAVALEDFDFAEQILHVRRQLNKLGDRHIYALPKNNREREVPLPDWAAAAVRIHLASHAPWSCTLPWEKLTGKTRTHNLLFRWPDDSDVRYRTYSEQVWKPALSAAGVIPKPGTDARGRRRYETSGKEGPHQLRHYYASVPRRGVGQGTSRVPRSPRSGIHPARLLAPDARVARPGTAGVRREDVPSSRRG